MADASRLVAAMQRAAKPKENDIVDIVVGTVTSVKPLKIKVDKLELTETFLVVGALCKAKSITIPNDTLAHTHTIPSSETEEATISDGTSHSHTISQSKTESGRGSFPVIQLWRGLQVGDDVIMIRCCQGQKYYVLQRKEGVI